MLKIGDKIVCIKEYVPSGIHMNKVLRIYAVGQLYYITDVIFIRPDIYNYLIGWNLKIESGNVVFTYEGLWNHFDTLKNIRLKKLQKIENKNGIHK